ncbi:putative metallopeptidase [Salinisphaera sp. SPP-AMP-43]
MPPGAMDPNAEHYSPSAWFTPSGDLLAWVRTTFIDEGAALQNPEHAHLEYADLAFLWAGVPNSKKGRTVLGTAETCPPQVTAGKWLKGRIEQQLVGWFSSMPDFLITLDANYALECSDMQFCALVEHELLHCAQEQDEYGAPKFTQEGLPKFGIRGHDVEEFASVVRRYGAPDVETAAFIQAGQQAPEIGAASVARACGTCLRGVA